MPSEPPAPLPADIIHSAAPTTTNPVPVEYSPSSKSRRFAIFSPRGEFFSRPPASLRKFFSPSARRAAANRHSTPIVQEEPEEESRPAAEHPRDSEDSSAITHQSVPALTRTRRRRWLWPYSCSCWVQKSQNEDSLQEVEFGHHLKTLEPTYEPKSPLLPSPPPNAEDRICLVLDLDETLVHSSFTPIDGADFEIPLEMQGETHTVYVKKRPGVDEFLAKVSQWYEIVVFTASLALYANPVMDLLDPKNLVQLRLYREHCVLIGGCYVKDIAKLGRDLKRTFIIDNSPLSYVLQPENAIPITAFFTDDSDRELEKTLALLEQAKHLKDVRKAFS